jgi:AAHS family 4-hydroxybenzoate transporter-like MFS transporter
MAEAYPTEFRNTGVSWCRTFGRMGRAKAPIVSGAIIGMNLGLRISFLFYVIPAAVGALAAFLFIKIETMGKLLDQPAQETIIVGH